jgi:hypothetical protein
MAFGLIGVGYFLYGVLLLAIKSCINKGFYETSKIDKLVHITGALNLPEAYGDWDDDGNLSITEHGQRWKAILSEMLLMTALQYITNLMLLIPLFVTGTILIIVTLEPVCRKIAVTQELFFAL